jgi:hypothetical protein
MKLEKRIELCQDCGMGYWKPFYEPMWLARILWKSSHSQYHGSDRHDAVVESWQVTARQEERERIIKLLDETLVYGEPVVIERDRLIALIKGEKNV